MQVSADALRQYVDYTAWATRRLLEAALRLTPEEQGRDFLTADKSVVGTLAHLLASETIWLERIQGGAPTVVARTIENAGMAGLVGQWARLHENWRTWAAGLRDEDADAAFRYSDFSGRPWSQPLWQIVLHVINHSTHHRGQIAGFLRAMGKTPPSVDFITFVRESGS
ncbi:MAG: DinB family protein [Bryobacteraceae bacterium]|nr:DinB family protein [Bryobacteraceae bacterium]